MRNYANEFKEIRRQARLLANSVEHKDAIIRISFTRYGRSVLRQLNREMHKDADLDFGLGILTEEQYKKEIEAYKIIESSIVLGNLY